MSEGQTSEEIERVVSEPINVPDPRVSAKVELTPDMFDPDYGKVEWYRREFPGFTDEQYEIMELTTWTDLTAKQIRNLVKKRNKKRCSK